MEHPIIVTQRMYLRQWNEKDAQFLFDLNSDPEVIRFTGDSSFGSIEKAREFIGDYDHYRKWTYGRWLCILRENETPIGWCGLKNQMDDLGIIDLGYRFVKSAWGKGFATEASMAVLDFGFQNLRIPKITGRVALGNDASEKVLLKCGMKFLHESDCEHHPAKWYQITASDWLSMQQLTS